MNLEKASTSGEAGPSHFESLPWEMKIMILHQVVNEKSSFYQFKKFWSLKRVSKEFNRILSSDYAKRHFYKYPCSVNIESRKYDEDSNDQSAAEDDGVITLQIICANDDILIYDQKINAIRSVRAGGNHYFVERGLRLRKADVLKYFKDRPFRIERLKLGKISSVEDMIPVLLEIASITPELWRLRIEKPINENGFCERVSRELDPYIRENKIDFDFSIPDIEVTDSDEDSDWEDIDWHHYWSFKYWIEDSFNRDSFGRIE